MKRIPRHYQRDHMAKMTAARKSGVKRYLLTSATGTGKGVLIGWTTQELLQEGIEPVLVIGHTDEIIGQCYKHVKAASQLDDFEIATEQGNQFASRESKVIVSSIQTLLSPRRLPDYKPKAIILDECHHFLAEAWQTALARLGAFNGETLLLGFTATAGRGDKKSIFCL